MMKYSIEEVCRITSARCVGRADGWVQLLLTDSRSLSFPEVSLFFALKTERNDGHHYVSELYRRGVRHFVVSQLPGKDLAEDANYLVVESPLHALQMLATHHRMQYSVPVVGITGSSGKTVVKEWIYQLLSPDKVVTRSPKSYNSQIGVPFSVWQLRQETELGLFEAGISQPGEMEILERIIRPQVGVLTNIGQAHQENFASLEEKCREKLLLFKNSNIVVCNTDNPVVASQVDAAELSKRLFRWSMRDDSADLFVTSLVKRECITHVTYMYEHCMYSYDLPMTDDASIGNSVCALATCLILGASPEVLNRRMERLEPVALRLEVKEGINRCVLISDSSGNDLKSLDIALDFAHRRQTQSHCRRLTLILSDILDNGISPDRLYADAGKLCRERGVDYVVGVGPEICHHTASFEMQSNFYASTKDLVESGALDKLCDELILLKGASPFRFDRLSRRLELRVHETTLQVNLTALVDNLNYYRSFLKQSTKMVCMVKASAYGAGAIEVSRTLQDHGVDYLAVAVADEGVELRRAGIKANIMVMNPEMSAFQDMFDYKLEPEVYNFRLLEALLKAAEKQGVSNFPVHIKLDTGMHRLGFHPEEDMDTLIECLKQQNNLIPRSIFSHFVGSDGDDFNDFTTWQFERFDKASSKFCSSFAHPILRHICNTAGIERFPQYQMDMVRLGLGLYGVDPYSNRMIHNVSTLQSTILQLRDVPAGDTVGYSRRGVLHRDSRIAAVPIGYADGLNRRLGRGNGYCLVNGQKAPYVGNICMDVCLVDVTDIQCREGDAVIIFGDDLPVTVLSNILETIPYEVLTSVSTRVKRVYTQE
jgi:alanine racemase